MTVQHCRSHISNGQSIEFTLGRTVERTGRSLNQVIAVTGLIINYAYISDGTLQESILCGGIGITGVYCAYVKRLAVRFTHYLIERSVILGIELAGGAVSGHALGSKLLIDVAGSLDLACATGQHQGGGNKDVIFLHIWL